MSPDGVELAVGDTLRMVASTSPSSCAPSDTVVSLTFESADTTVVSIATDGLATGRRPGSAALRVTARLASGGSGTGTATLRIVAPRLRVKPDRLSITVGTSSTFTASLGSVEIPVTWSVSDAFRASITSAGELHTCWPGGVFRVIATAAADPTVSGEATVQLVEAGTGIGIMSISDAATGGPISIDSLSRDVDIDVGVPANDFVCRAVTGLTLRLEDSTGALTTVGADSTVRPPQPFIQRFRFRPAAVPNGEYQLQPAVTIDHRVPVFGSRTPIRIRH